MHIQRKQPIFLLGFCVLCLLIASALALWFTRNSGALPSRETSGYTQNSAVSQ